MADERKLYYNDINTEVLACLEETEFTLVTLKHEMPAKTKFKKGRYFLIFPTAGIRMEIPYGEYGGAFTENHLHLIWQVVTHLGFERREFI